MQPKAPNKILETLPSPNDTTGPEQPRRTRGGTRGMNVLRIGGIEKKSFTIERFVDWDAIGQRAPQRADVERRHIFQGDDRGRVATIPARGAPASMSVACKM